MTSEQIQRLHTEALMEAVLRGNPEQVSDLLAGRVTCQGRQVPNPGGQQVNAEHMRLSLDDDQIGGCSALFAVAGEAHNPAVVSILLAAGSDVNKLADDPEAGGLVSPLIIACHWANAVTVPLLIEANADVDLRASQLGATALHQACKFLCAPAARDLLNAGANPNAVTSLRTANRKHHGETGVTPLWYASIGGDMEIVDMLLQAGASVNLQRANGTQSSALFVAAQEGHTEVTRRLLEAKAETAVVCGKLTPLDVARTYGHLDIVDYITQAHDEEASSQERCAVCECQGKLLRCSRCKLVRYCSTECQQRDFKQHKRVCTPAAETQEEPAEVPREVPAQEDEEDEEQLEDRMRVEANMRMKRKHVSDFELDNMQGSDGVICDGCGYDDLDQLRIHGLNCPGCKYTVCDGCACHNSRGLCYCKDANFGHSGEFQFW